MTRLRSLATHAALSALTLLALAPSVSSAVVFTNSTSIAIPNIGIANPYPSNIVVSGLTGTITDLEVVLRNLSHTFPDDIDVLLVGPTGANLVLFSNIGSFVPASGLTFTLDAAAANFLPDNGSLTGGTFKPTNYPDGDDIFPAPAPAGPFNNAGPTGTATLASVFNGTDPNGTWSLYVTDDSGGDSGSIAGGWSLQITTAVTAVPEPASLALLGLGLAGLGFTRYRRRV